MLCRYYHNITSNTLVVLEAMAAHKVKTLIYSSTCATYGEPVKMPITEQTPQVSFWFTLSFLVLYYDEFSPSNMQML
jgi:nucleoside-diphosphate-sugar epimerase